MRGPIDRVRHGSWRDRLIVGLSVLVILGGVAFGVYRLLVDRSWVDQPALLLPLQGNLEVEVRPGAPPEPVQEQTWVQAGGVVRGSGGSLAVLQYFDQSAVKIEGDTEVRHVRSQSLKGQPLSGGRRIELQVLRGKATVVAMRQTLPGSVFDIETSNSVGVIEGTSLQVLSDGQGRAVWTVGSGTVRVAVIAVGPAGEGRIAVVKLRAGYAVSVPRVPSEWLGSGVYEKLQAWARDIARSSVGQPGAEVAVKDATLVAADETTGTAVYEVPVVKSEERPVAADLPAGYEVVHDDVLSSEAPSVVLGRTADIPRLLAPTLCSADFWDDAVPDPTLRVEPPAYLFSIYDVARPLGVAVDPDGGRILVSESDAERVTRVFDREGNPVAVLAPPNTEPGQRSPVYLAIDGAGTVYVSDRTRHVIDMYDVNGVYLGIFDPVGLEGSGWSPLGLSVDGCNNLYVTDVSGNTHRVLVFGPAGDLKLEISGEGEDALAFPSDVAIDGLGRIYVSDSNNFRLLVFDDKGNLLGVYSGQEFPRGIGTDGRYLYLVDTFGHGVLAYDLERGMQPVFGFGARGIGDGQFNFPNGLALDSAGRLYVTDRENNRLQVWGY